MRPAPTTPQPDSRLPRVRLAIALIVVCLGLIGLAVWAAQRHWREASLLGITQGVVEDLSKDLPKAYGDGLVLESVRAEPGRVLMVVRSTRRSLDTASRDLRSLEIARTIEQQVMLGYCDNPSVKQVLSTGVVFVRRYLDLQDRLFFEVGLTAEDCRRRNLRTPS
ncbi:hypothetical protein [Arenimonas sp. MALMAid1274]|uniref:hypothetical protein n=1 Tax=Arenimonas sp. MALMAid1274 TaxID=3411630 RepID=UPI003BA0B112